MLPDLDSRTLRRTAMDEHPGWSVLVPFFNERDLLARTIESLAAQEVPVRIVLIDNGSTDDSAAIARATCDRLKVDHLLVTERIPGKVAALAAGLRRVGSRYVATCDADTYYPTGYLAAAERLLVQENCVVAGAYFACDKAEAVARRRAGAKMCATARILPRQCHTGGAGQAFRTDVLNAAGGFDVDRWNYVLEDHEIVHRVTKYGAMRYGAEFWCAPSARERDRASIRWTLAERLTYSATAAWAGDWFFYGFLAARLRGRRLVSERIRERAFQSQSDDPREGRTVRAATYPVCG